MASTKAGPKTTASPDGAGKRTVLMWWQRLQPWLSLVARLALAFILLRAAIPKLQNLRGSQLNVIAYNIFPISLANLIGIVLPVVEAILGVILLVGLLTRWAALVFGLMLIAFIAGIASAWARGLTIDCGCFAVGGLEPGAKPNYLLDILRDVGFLAIAAFAVLWPKAPLALDTLLRLDPVKAPTGKDK
ncbi:MAG: DoxX family membrane protein [Bifidobacteriaceae bacterium]|jgi:uncharacterized membrane protein YphA (DoxX/SURF4 family)|nr:DoxX family membrane protein [Bifidobacteriaceae bacterium]